MLARFLIREKFVLFFDGMSMLAWIPLDVFVEETFPSPSKWSDFAVMPGLLVIPVFFVESTPSTLAHSWFPRISGFGVISESPRDSVSFPDAGDRLSQNALVH